MIVSAFRKMLDSRPVKLGHPFENALARQFVFWKEKTFLWAPLPPDFNLPNWLEMPKKSVKNFFKIRQFNSGRFSAVFLGCCEKGKICVIKFRNDGHGNNWGYFQKK